MKTMTQSCLKHLSQEESQWQDLMRIFLLIQVILGHMSAIALPSFSQLASDPTQNWLAIIFRLFFRFGAEAAFLFVFLSGFMVAGPLFACTRVGQVPSASNFFSKRLLRIFPISLGALILTVLLDSVSLLTPGGVEIYRTSYAYDMVEAFNWTNLIGNLLFLQPILVDSFGSNGPLWTLGYIFQYYILGWLFCKTFVTSKNIALILLVFLVTFMAAVRAEWAILFISWLSGGIARNVYVSKRQVVPFLLIGFLLFIVSNRVGTLISACISIVIGFFLTMSLRHLPVIRCLNKGSILRRVSNESYAIYAVHHPALMLIYAVGFLGSINTSLRFFLYVSVSLVFAVIVTKTLIIITIYLEKKLKEYINNFSKN